MSSKAIKLTKVSKTCRNVFVGDKLVAQFYVQTGRLTLIKRVSEDLEDKIKEACKREAKKRAVKVTQPPPKIPEDA